MKKAALFKKERGTIRRIMGMKVTPERLPELRSQLRITPNEDAGFV